MILILVRFIWMFLIVKLGYLRLKDDEDDLADFSPAIQDVLIEHDFSHSDVIKSHFTMKQ